MRILILTHERSGGMNLLMWLCREFSMGYYNEPFNCYHEPFNNSSEPPNLLKMENIIVKEFPERIKENFDTPINDFISTFDYVIILIRNNTYETAISATFMRSPERGKIHVQNVYNVDDLWIEKNKQEILLKQKELEEKIKFLKSIENGLVVSYENIYENTSDIENIKNYLKIKSTKFTEILNNRHKLRNGKFGMKHYLI
jgi:hypothetical protein